MATAGWPVVPIALIADDVTVKRASSTSLNARKTERLVHQARLAGEPIIYFGEAGGARLPDVLSGDVFASEPIYPWLFDLQTTSADIRHSGAIVRWVVLHRRTDLTSW